MLAHLRSLWCHYRGHKSSVYYNPGWPNDIEVFCNRCQYWRKVRHFWGLDA